MPDKINPDKIIPEKFKAVKFNAVIFGATSGIASEVCKILVKEHNSNLLLVGRDTEKLEILKTHLKVFNEHSKIETFVKDLSETVNYEKILEDGTNYLGDINLVFIAHGILLDNEKCEGDFKNFQLNLNTNYSSVVAILNETQKIFVPKRNGIIAVISSVAGDRGRKSNYHYGATKGALSIYLEGLRGKLDEFGINVINIKPGFVDTNMTKTS